MSRIELLASIACSLAQLNGMSCSPADLKNQASCIWPCMSEIELLAAIAANVCSSGSGGGGGGGGPSGAWIYWEDAHLDDNPPPFPTKAAERRFRNGDSPLTWDPTVGAWF